MWHIETQRSDNLSPREYKVGLTIECVCVAVVLVYGLFLGSQIFKERLGIAEFYQPFFAPALNLACNGEFNEIKADPATQEFLDFKSKTLDSCAGVENLPVRQIRALSSTMGYLELMVAGAWRILGLDWRSLSIVAALLTAALALSGYGLFRVFCESRVACALGTLAFMSSPVLVAQIPNLRDFSKGPFLVASLACLAAAVVPVRPAISTVLFMAAAGSLVSIGLGFRTDMNVVIPIALLAPLLQAGRVQWRETLRVAMMAWAAFAVGYITLRLPLSLVAPVGNVPSGTLLPHVFILGFSERSLSQLGFATADYSLLRIHLDETVYAITNLFAGTATGGATAWGSASYDEATAKLLRAMFLLTPQDAFFRLFYTFNAIGHLPPISQIWGVLLLILAFLLLLTRLRALLFILLSFTVLGTALTLQFDPRHAFYMVVLGPAIVLLALSAGSSLLGAAAPLLRNPRLLAGLHGHLPTRRVVGFGLLALFAVGGAAALTILLGALQRDALSRLVHAYSAIEWQSISYRKGLNTIEPDFVNKATGKEFGDFVHTQQDGGGPLPLNGPVAFSRLTLNVRPIGERFPFLPSWVASQEHIAIPNDKFEFSTEKRGYAVESGQISGTDLTSYLGGKGLPLKVLMHIKGETLTGVYNVAILNSTKTKFAFYDRLPRGKWEYAKSIEITPDLATFTILFDNPGGRSTIRIDSVELILPPATCGATGSTVTSKYIYAGAPAEFGGFRLPARSGTVTYYFPIAFMGTLHFSSLSLGELSPDCVVDWSIAKSFPTGDAPSELVLVDGDLNTLRRGDWPTVWHNFSK